MILLTISVRYPLRTGLLGFRRWSVKPIQSELFFLTTCFILNLTSSYCTRFKTKDSATRSIMFPLYGFSIFFASEGPIFTKKLLRVSESIVFVICNFLYVFGRQIWFRYLEKLLPFESFCLSKFFCSTSFWHFLLVFLFCCSVNCIVLFYFLWHGRQKNIPKTLFLLLEQAFLTSLVIQFRLFSFDHFFWVIRSRV